MTWFYTCNVSGDPIYIGREDATRYAMSVPWPNVRARDRRDQSLARDQAHAQQREVARTIVDTLNHAPVKRRQV